MKRIEVGAIEWVNLVNLDVESVTPMDTGDLRDSQYITRQVTLNGFIIETGFNTPYAPIVHEWPDTINWTTPGTGNKYLQRPYFSQAVTLLSFITTKVRI